MKAGKERKDGEGEGGLKMISPRMGREQTERKLALYPLLLIVALVFPLERVEGNYYLLTFF